MGKFDKAPVVDFDRLEELQKNPDLTPAQIMKMRKEKEASLPPPVNPPPPAFRPGSGFKTSSYPEYEGTDIYVIVGTANNRGLVRYTIELPPMPPTPPIRKLECPYCRVPFVGAELITPGRGARESQTIDITTTAEEFAESLKIWRAVPV
jgi:hypothetical protein